MEASRAKIVINTRTGFGRGDVKFDSNEPPDYDKYYYKKFDSIRKFKLECAVYRRASHDPKLGQPVPSWACNHDSMTLRLERIHTEQDGLVSLDVLKLCEQAAIKKIQSLHSINIAHGDIEDRHILIKNGIMNRGDAPVDDYVYLIDFDHVIFPKFKDKRRTDNYKALDLMHLWSVFRYRIAVKATADAKHVLDSSTPIDQANLAHIIIDANPNDHLASRILALPNIRPILIFALVRALSNWNYLDSYKDRPRDIVKNYLTQLKDGEVQLGDTDMQYISQMKNDILQLAKDKDKCAQYDQLVAEHRACFGGGDPATLRTAFSYAKELRSQGKDDEAGTVLEDIRAGLVYLLESDMAEYPSVDVPLISPIEPKPILEEVDEMLGISGRFRHLTLQ